MVIVESLSHQYNLDKGLKQVRGTACLVNNEWEVKEIY